MFLVVNFAPEARGHGVPEVLDAIYYKEGNIRPVVAAIKSLASAFSIGTGAAVGREGPIIQIGATLGSSLGQIIEMAPWQRITLVAAGAGAGIAATFNTPIGGVMFAIELMLPELSARTFLPVALATGTATFIGRIFLGLQPAFVVPSAFYLHTEQPPIQALLLFALLGALIGLAATAFIRGLVFAEDIFPKIKNPYLRHMVGMLMVGLLMYALFYFQGHYFVEGVGYATIQAILEDNLVGFALLLGLFAAKLFATTVSLGSGASGGIFSPSLFMGATLGAAFGGFVTAIGPVHGVDPVTCAIIGMAAMVGGGTGAAMTAVTMIFEMTRDYDIIMPIIVAVALSHRRTAAAVAREHLHRQAGDPRPCDPQGAARQYVPGAPRRRGDGPQRAGAAGGNRLRRLFARDLGRRLQAHRGDERRAHRRRAARQYRAAVGAGKRLFRRAPGRHRAEEFHRLARRGRRLRRGRPHVAARRQHVDRHQGRRGIPRGGNIVGMISKEHIADSVADSIKPYSSDLSKPD